MENAAEIVSEPYEKKRATSRKMLLPVLSNIRYLTRQSLPIRGNWNNETKAEEDSNFSQLIKLKSEEDPKILKWLERKSYKYTSPEMQNEML